MEPGEDADNGTRSDAPAAVEEPLERDLKASDVETNDLLRALAKHEERSGYRPKKRPDPIDLYLSQISASGSGTLLTRREEFTLATRMVRSRRAWLASLLSYEGRMDTLERINAIIAAWKSRKDDDPRGDEDASPLSEARRTLASAEELFEHCDAETESADDVLRLLRIAQWVCTQERMLRIPVERNSQHRQMDARRNAWVAARDELVRRNLLLVVACAKKYWKQRRDKDAFLELIQEGNAALTHAADKFKPELGFKFSTYASWGIRQAMQAYTRRQHHPEQSLSLPAGEKGESPLSSLLADPSAPDAVTEASRLELREALLRATGRVPQGLRKYLRRFGLGLQRVMNTSGVPVTIFHPDQYGREMTCEELGRALENPRTGEPGVSDKLVSHQSRKVLALLRPDENLRQHWEEMPR